MRLSLSKMMKRRRKDKTMRKLAIQKVAAKKLLRMMERRQMSR